MLIELLLRWGHIYAAVALAGSIWFWYLALEPATRQGATDWFVAARRKWAPIVGIASGLLLATGLYNFIHNVVTYKLPPWYHALGLFKLILGMLLFFIAAKLTGASPSAARFQQQAGRWLAIASLSAVLLVGMGGVMRVGSADRVLKDKAEEATSVAPAGGSPASVEESGAR